MDPSRSVLTDRQWSVIEPFCPGGKHTPGRTGSDTRLFLEAILWIVRTDAPWRDLPKGFGNWNSTFRRFRRWVQADVFKRIFDALSDQPDMEYAMIDVSGRTPCVRESPRKIVKVHRHGMGAKGGSKPGHRQIQRRLDDEGPGPRGCSRQPCPVRADAREPIRYNRRRAVGPRH